MQAPALLRGRATGKPEAGQPGSHLLTGRALPDAAHTAKAGFLSSGSSSDQLLLSAFLERRVDVGLDPQLEARKRALREAVRSRLPRPGSAGFIDASVAAQERLASSGPARDAQVVGLYRALPSECGTASLAAALEAAGKEICYPVVVPGERALSFRRAAGVFVAGALGIEEPTGAPVPLTRIDLLVLPALAVDCAGRRLGRGKGHFDATLAGFGGEAVALVFEAQVVDDVPAGSHDRRVSAFCTDVRFFRVSA